MRVVVLVVAWQATILNIMPAKTSRKSVQPLSVPEGNQAATTGQNGMVVPMTFSVTWSASLGRRTRVAQVWHKDSVGLPLSGSGQGDVQI